MIVFVEDGEQLLKMQKNYLKSNNFLLITYRGRRVQKLEISEAGKITRVNLLKLYKVVYAVFSSKTIVVEYANLLPRIFAFFLRKQIISLIFGTLTQSNFRKHRFIPEKLQPLRADTFIIFGRYNQTKKIVPFLETFADAVQKNRTDIPNFINLPVEEYILYVGQSFDKEEMHFYQDAEDEIVNSLIQGKYSVVYCRHPRSKRSVSYENEVEGYRACIRYIEENGRPLLAVSLTSSMINELQETEINAFNLISGEYLCEKILPDFDLIKPYVR